MTEPHYELCSCCGVVQTVPEHERGFEARCVSCETRLREPWKTGADPTPTFAVALAALILYPLAISLPILSIERFGQRAEASIWTGSVGLLEAGQWFVGVVVLVCSIVLPLLKLISLLVLTGIGEGIARRHRALTWHLLELTGRWGMLDVLLIAVLVAWLKLGDLVRVTPGPGAIAFTACVVLSLLGSFLFDPRSVWHHKGSARGRVSEAGAGVQEVDA